MKAITARGLEKTYTVKLKKGLFTRNTKTIEALKGVSFDIEEGELVGYIGPNGAGKSTTVKILSGILVPDGGQCDVLGLCPWKQRIKHAANIGVVFGQRSQLWWDLPVRDSFVLLRDIYRIKDADYKKSLDELVGSLELEPLLDSPVRQLSLGQRMRCELAASLLHDPKVLFLDEPTIGLDAATKIAVRTFIKRINREMGVTAILTTHDMDDIESLCSRVMLIGNGEKLIDGDISLLRKGHDRRILNCRVNGDTSKITLKSPVISCETEPGSIKVQFDHDKVTAAALIREINEVCEIIDISVADTPIEQVVAQVYAEMAGRA